MNPTLKKILAAVAAKKGFDKIQELRRPKKPSFFARIAPVALIAGAGGGTYYLAKTGKLQPLVDRVKGKTSARGYTTYPSSPAPASSSVDPGIS